MHPMVENARCAIQEPEVKEMLQKLSKYGLGIFMPHMHPEEGGFLPLPKDTVQLEGDLKVSFVSSADPLLEEAVPVGWIWDENHAIAAVSCYCGGASHGPSWGWHKEEKKPSPWPLPKPK